MVIVDDHLGLDLIVGDRPAGLPAGPVAITYGFHYRLVRAVASDQDTGALARRVAGPALALQRVLRPPIDRLVALDPREGLAEAAAIANRHAANLLLAELVGAALHHRAAVRVTSANCGRAWPAIMAAEGVDFATI